MVQLLFVLVLVTLFNSSFQQANRIRLVGGSGAHEGRVEVRPSYSYSWGTVCDDSFGMNDARVVCRMLGYSGASAVRDSTYYGQGSGNIYMDDLRCTGTETSLFDCPYNGWGVENCGHSEDVGVVCYTGSSSDPANRIRLAGGSRPNEGRVEVRPAGSYNWGTVCDDSFGMNDARVVCRMLGYSGATAVRDSTYYGQGSGNIYMDELRCTGTETSLFDCPYAGWGVDDCTHSEDVGVVCYTTSGTTPMPDNGCRTVRISGSSSTQSSRMTTYTMTGQLRYGRPVYQSSRGDYLYYYQLNDRWHVGTHFNARGMYVDDTSIYAEDISGTWYLYDGDYFRPNTLVRITCVHATPTSTSTSTPLRPVSTGSELSAGAIVGISIGVVAAVALIIVISYCCCCKKSAPVATTAQNSQPAGTTNPSFQPAPSGPPPPYSPPTQPQPEGLVFIRVVRIQ